MKPTINVNGTITPADQAVVRVLDRGVLYGDSVYEVLWWHRGAPIQLDDHLARLERSGVLLYMPLPFSRELLVEAMVQTAQAAGVAPTDDAYIRLVVTRGEGPVQLDIGEHVNPKFIVIVKEAQRPDADTFAKGLYVAFVGRPRSSIRSPDPQAKTGNYLTNMLAKHEATQAGADDALLLNTRGHVTEATTSNVFLICDGTLRTPALSEGLLEGTTRMRILALCEELGIPAHEGIVTPDDMRTADEAFVSSSVRGILPIVRVDDVVLSQGPGPMTRRLHEAFEAAASSDAAAWHVARTARFS